MVAADYCYRRPDINGTWSVSHSFELLYMISAQVGVHPCSQNEGFDCQNHFHNTVTGELQSLT